MGFFADEELASLRLARMCLHVVGGEAGFEAQPELPVEHDDFLLKVLKGIASDSVYKFRDRSPARSVLESMATRESSFESGAQALAEDFGQVHRGRHRDGAFFVFELGVADEEILIYALVKYDYTQALELVQREGVNGLRRIVEAFSADRGSVQKAAIIRTRNGVADVNISTRDRMGKPSPTLTDYFRDFLKVERTRADKDLTIEVKKVIRTVLKDHSEYLPDHVSTSVSRGLDVLRRAEVVTEELVRDAVLAAAGEPTDPDIRAKLEAAVTRQIRLKKLSGLEFAPAQTALRQSVRRKVMMEEGVTLEYDTDLEGGSIKIIPLPGGSTRFEVTTKGFKDDVVPDPTERKAQ